MPLNFPTLCRVAEDGFVSFMAEDARNPTKWILCTVTNEALAIRYGADVTTLGFQATFVRHQDRIEAAASDEYDAQQGRGQLVRLEAGDWRL